MGENEVRIMISNIEGEEMRVVRLPRSFMKIPDLKNVGNILCPACKKGYIKPFLMESSKNGDGGKLLEFRCGMCSNNFTGIYEE